MPPTSKEQKTLACIALNIKLGKTKPSYSKEGARMARTMTEEQLREYCESPVKES
jgi:hypothetical protein